MEMQDQIMGYDRAATMFSPDGHLLQVEYAEKTVRLGSSSIGFSCKDGIVIIADKRVRDKLIVPESSSKIFEVDEHIMASAAGILSDARILIEKGQLSAQQHRIVYGEGSDVESVIKELSDLKQQYTQYGGVRPFGVSIMLAGITGTKGRLYVSDVTGNYFEYKAAAIGENDEKIREMLREEYNEEITIEDAIKLGLKLFKNILGKNFEINRFEISYIQNDDKKIKKVEDLKKYSK